jgi:hypothetical protein
MYFLEYHPCLSPVCSLICHVNSCVVLHSYTQQPASIAIERLSDGWPALRTIMVKRSIPANEHYYFSRDALRKSTIMGMRGSEKAGDAAVRTELPGSVTDRASADSTSTAPPPVLMRMLRKEASCFETIDRIVDQREQHLSHLFRGRVPGRLPSSTTARMWVCPSFCFASRAMHAEDDAVSSDLAYRVRFNP